LSSNGNRNAKTTQADSTRVSTLSTTARRRKTEEHRLQSPDIGRVAAQCGMTQEKTRAQLTRRGLKSLDRVDLFQRGEPTHEAMDTVVRRIASML
jgi:hypothetical protein